MVQKTRNQQNHESHWCAPGNDVLHQDQASSQRCLCLVVCFAKQMCVLQKKMCFCKNKYVFTCNARLHGHFLCCVAWICKIKCVFSKIKCAFRKKPNMSLPSALDVAVTDAGATSSTEGKGIDVFRKKQMCVSQKANTCFVKSECVLCLCQRWPACLRLWVVGCRCPACLQP